MRCSLALFGVVHCALFGVVHCAPVGVSFNETLVGYGIEGGNANDTIADFMAAYEKGKAANTTLGFGTTCSRVRSHQSGLGRQLSLPRP